MRKKSIFIIMLIMVMASSLVMTSCGKSSKESSEPKTLEEYAVKNPEVQKSIDEATSGSDVDVDIKENTVIYSFELSKMEGYTEEVAKDENVIKSLQDALDNAGPTFGGIAKTLESSTGISGIKVTVIYTFDGETLATQTFDASDASEAASAEQNEDSEEDSDSDSDSETEEGGSDSESE